MDDALLDELFPMPDPTALPRVFSLREARDLGHTDHMIEHRLATGRWRRVLPRTYLTVDTLTWPDRQRAALAYAGTDAVITGAAALCDDLRSVARPRSVLVLVPERRGVRSRDWVRVRRTERLPHRRLEPGPARAPFARAVADLAVERRRLDDVRALVAEAVRRDLCTVDELLDELESGPRQGSAHLRMAIGEVSAGSWSAPEARAAHLMRRAGIAPFEQNVRIRLPGGQEFVADFLWRELRAVLEIDSVEHHFSPADLDATMRRHLLLETLGYSVIHRSPAVLITSPHQFLRDVSDWLGARAALLGR